MLQCENITRLSGFKMMIIFPAPCSESVKAGQQFSNFSVVTPKWQLVLNVFNHVLLLNSITERDKEHCPEENKVFLFHGSLEYRPIYWVEFKTFLKSWQGMRSRFSTILRSSFQTLRPGCSRFVTTIIQRWVSSPCPWQSSPAGPPWQQTAGLNLFRVWTSPEVSHWLIPCTWWNIHAAENKETWGGWENCSQSGSGTWYSII